MAASNYPEDQRDSIVYSELPGTANDSISHDPSQPLNEDNEHGIHNGTTSKDQRMLLPNTHARQQKALDNVISKIGMGRFQWQLLILCGFGWMADNMWLQSIAVILPRVQEHFGISNDYIGILTSSMFTGMMIGALFWGIVSDIHGRKQAFNLTMLLTTFFGMFASFSSSFPMLCVSLVLLGLGVGGNMPVDGALFLEFIPQENQYLLTFLSVFFSFGAVISSLLALILIPANSCPEHPNPGTICDVATQNNGWRYQLAVLAFITFIMLMLRLMFFRLQESPKFLLNNNRKHDAVMVLRRIIKINRKDMVVHISDLTPSEALEGDVNWDTFPVEDDESEESENFIQKVVVSEFTDPQINRQFSITSEPWKYIKSQFLTHLHQFDPLFTPKWYRTTVLIWAIWILVGIAYTMFNAFLPKFLEESLKDSPAGGRTEALIDYVIYSAAGCPGSVIGAYMIETRLGRRWSMSLSTLGTAISTFFFIGVHTRVSLVLSSMMISFLATLMYAVIYSYTPEVFEPRIRGTACGAAAALNRLMGIISPVATGILLSISSTLPLFVSAFIFILSAICMIMLPYETRVVGKTVAAQNSLGSHV